MPPHDHHTPPNHRWIYNAEGLVNPTQAGELFARLATSISNSGEVELAEERVTLPDQMRAVVRHEVLPRGELVVKVELIWNSPTDIADRSIAELLA
ncbi:MAG TPA: hypothetical protein VGL57_01225 [Solirubrobacteraceae bacterium]|jgi:hypothetical protein